MKKNSLRHFLPEKAKKLGFKVRGCDVCGLMHDYGSGLNVVESCGSQSSDFVKKLCETFPKHINLKVYFDNWFMSFELQILLKSWGIWSVGIVRTNRVRNCSLESESELKN